MLTFIFCLSGALEEYTTSKSQQEITALMNLQPRKAQRLTANEELEEIAVTDLKINDRVFVPKGGTIPIDGYLESQQATVDEATLSGESVPVEKVPHDELFAGTINRGNPLILQVTKKVMRPFLLKSSSWLKKHKAPLQRPLLLSLVLKIPTLKVC